jgi:hypothetical protein
MPQPSDSVGLTSVVNNVLSVIGRFDLDPNRVIDVILDAFEQQPENLAFITLLSNFRQGNIVHILGFKLGRFYEKENIIDGVAATDSTAVAGTSAKAGTEPVADVPKPPALVVSVPSSLLFVAALLIMNNLVSILDLLPYLEPDIVKTCEQLKTYEVELKKLFGEMNVLASLPKYPKGLIKKVVKAQGGSNFKSAALSEDAAIIRPPPPATQTPSSTDAASGSKSNPAPPTSGSRPPPPAYPPPKDSKDKAVSTPAATASAPALKVKSIILLLSLQSFHSLTSIYFIFI